MWDNGTYITLNVICYDVEKY